MSETSGFFVSQSGDRKYTPGWLAGYIKALVTTGVYSAELGVVAEDGMVVIVSKGRAWIEGYLYLNDSPLELAIATADSAMPRRDSVIIRLNMTERTITAMVLTGAYSTDPVAPAVTRTADIYDLKIAEVYVAAGTTKITQSMIKDTRLDDSVCGITVSVVQHIPTADYMASMEAEFREWFAYVKGIIGGDEAESLLSMAAAAPYGTTQTYKQGTYCTRNGKLYRCIADISEPEAWTASHWMETTVGNEMESHAENKDIHVTEKERQTWINKQDAISGAEGQFVGFDADGKPTAQDSWQSNRNFLDNPWFTVNQRGKDQYGNSEAVQTYTFDRWFLSNGYFLSCSKNDDGTININSTSGNHFAQFIEAPSRLLGKTVTISVNHNGVIKSETITLPTAFPSASTNYGNIRLSENCAAFLRLYADGKIRFCIGDITIGTPVWSVENIKAVKLELGNASTLAKDVSPNYAEELAKCQRFAVKMEIRCQKGGAEFISYPVTMRAHPSIQTISSEGGFVTASTQSIDGLIVNNSDTAWSRVIVIFATADL